MTHNVIAEVAYRYLDLGEASYKAKSTLGHLSHKGELKSRGVVLSVRYVF
jgi:opacity protein-like surface antigen